MESSRLLLQSTRRAASLLSHSKREPYAFPFAPTVLRQQCACLSTTRPRYADPPPSKERQAITSWFAPKNATKGQAKPPPPPPKMPDSPTAASAPAYKGKTMAWSSLYNTKQPPSKQREAARQRQELADDMSLNVGDIMGQRGAQDSALIEQRIRPFFRRKPETGKMVQLKPGKIDLVAALGRLAVKVGMNRVNHELNMQREHERPGLRRKRLRSERWKRTFSAGYKYAVLRANQLSKMGW